MPTFIPKPADIDRKWFVIDAQDMVLGNVATKAAAILSGKTKPIYTPFLDTGDHVVVINAGKVHLTGRKEEEKTYYQHSGYLGGMKAQTAIEVRGKKPERLIEAAIRGMLPKTRLGRAMFTKLKVYAGSAHPHQAQKPQPVTIK
jgi:large subunit ribosomal protein L13